MKKESITAFVSFLILFCVVPIFTSFVYSNSFQKLARESVLENYSFVFSEAAEKLKDSLGENETYSGDTSNVPEGCIRNTLAEAASCIPQGVFQNVRLIDGENIIFDSNSGAGADKTILPYIERRAVFNEGSNVEVKYQGELHQLIPIYQNSDTDSNTSNNLFLDVTLKDSGITQIGSIKDQISKVSRYLFITAFIIILIASLVLLISIYFISFKNKNGSVYKRHIICVAFILMFLVQSVICFFYTNAVLQDHFQKVLESDLDTSVAKWIDIKMNTLINSGGSYNDMKPELHKISSIGPYARAYIKYDSEIQLSKSDGLIQKDTNAHYSPLNFDKVNPTGLYIVFSSKYKMKMLIKTLIFTFLPILILSFLLTFTVCRFVAAKFKTFQVCKDEIKHINGSLYLRVSAFTFVTGIAAVLAVTFPRIGRFWLPDNVINISENPELLTYAVPIALGMMFCSLPFFGVGFLRIGRAKIYAFGVLISCSGIIIDIFSENMLNLCVSYCLCGLGVGFCLMVLQNAPSNNLGRVLFTGLLSGITVGTLICDNIGWETALYTSVLLVFISGIVMTVFSKSSFGEPSKIDYVIDEGNNGGFFTILAFLIVFIQLLVLEMLFYFDVSYYLYSTVTGEKGTVAIALALAVLGFITACIGCLVRKALTSFINTKLYVVLSGIFANILLFFAFSMHDEESMGYKSVPFIILLVSASIFTIGWRDSAYKYYCELGASNKINVLDWGKWNVITWLGRGFGILILGCIMSREWEAVDNYMELLCVCGVNVAMLFMMFTWINYKNTVITRVKV